MELVHVFDVIITAAYFAMPLELLYFTYKLPLKDWKSRLTCLLFSMFIGFCGITHLLHVFDMTLTNQVIYGLTALISSATVVVLLFVIPHMLGLPAKLEAVRIHGSSQDQFAEFVRRVTVHTIPTRDPCLLLVAYHVLKDMYPALGNLRYVPQADTTGDGMMIARDDSTLLMVDKSVYEQYGWFFNEVTTHMRLLMEPAKQLHGVDRLYIM